MHTRYLKFLVKKTEITLPIILLFSMELSVATCESSDTLLCWFYDVLFSFFGTVLFFC